jgi:2-hydroxy-6-oxonona-2,4-dienedioate hydrolase
MLKRARKWSEGTMRRAIRYRFIVLLAIFVVPVSSRAQAQLTDKTIAVFGQSIRYWDLGSGPVVVLLHGFGEPKEDWRAATLILAQKYRVLVPDQIGFGQSDKPLIDYCVQTYVDFLNEFLRKLKVEKASLVGESFGGWVAGLYASELSSDEHLIPVEKLVLVDAGGLKQDAPPLPGINTSSLAGMRRLMEAVFYDTSWLNEDALRKIFTDRLAVNDGYTAQSLIASFVQSTERLDNRLGSIKTPTLVVWGKQDKLVPIAFGERYASGIAGAKLVTFDKCGHVPPIEKTEEFVAAVTAFLGGTGAR